MKEGKTRWLLVGVLCLAFWLAGCSNKEKRWEGLIADGETAYQAGRYAEAEKLFLAALKEAEEFGGQDPRLATSLNNLAALFGRGAQPNSRRRARHRAGMVHSGKAVRSLAIAAW